MDGNGFDMSLSLNALHLLQKRRLPQRAVILPASAGGVDYRTKHTSDRIEMLSGRWSAIYDGFSFDEDQISYVSDPAGASVVFPGFLDHTCISAQAACCRRTFVPAKAAKGGRVLLHAEGLVGAACVYCNGQSVGASADGAYAAEFDLTPLIDLRGENEIAFVFLCGDRALCRCGIIDDIYLIYQSTDGLWDYEIRTRTDGIDVRLQPYSGKQGLRAEVTFDRRVRKADLFSEAVVSFTLPSPEVWNAERVYTYDLVITVLFGDTVVEVYKKKIGLRTCAVIDGMLCLNETPVVFRGVTYQPYSDSDGVFRTGEEIGADLRLIQSCHFNAIALCAPASPRIYEYCTEMGLYVMQGTAAVSTRTDVSEIESYAEQAYARTKNEACVLLRSAAFTPSAHAVCRAYYQRQVSAVPFLAADDGTDTAFDSSFSDIRAVAYPVQQALQEMMQTESDVPTLICAYRTERIEKRMSAAAIWEMIDAYPQLQGAFLDGFFGVCCEWDGTPLPIMQSLKYWMNPLGISDTGDGLTVYCRRNFERADNCTMIWNLCADGHPLRDGIVTGLEFGPGEIKRIPYPTSFDGASVPGAEYLLNVMFFCGEQDLGYAQALLHTSKAPPRTSPTGNVAAEIHGETVVLVSDTARAVVENGCLCSYTRDARLLLSAPAAFAVFENGVLQSARSSVREMSVVHTELAAVLSCRVTLETMCTVLDIDLRYTLYTDGVLHICAVCMTEIPSAVTFGFSLDGFAVGREIGWYGLGWKASTFGERDGSLIGRYSARVEEIADPSSAVLSLRRKTRYIVCDMTNGRVLLCTDQKLSFGVQKEKIYLLSDDGNALSVAVKPYVCEEEARESIRVSYDASDK